MTQIKNLLLSTAYFPPLSYCMLLAQSEQLLLEAKETYPKQTYRNRCIILTANGLQNLSVPVKKPNGNHTKTSEILISYDENWQKQHQKALTSAYSAAPFFDHYMDVFLSVFEKKHASLLELNLNILTMLQQVLGLNQSIRLTETFEKNSLHCFDARDLIHPKTGNNLFIAQPYYQVFSDRFGFQADLSILDLLFNEGPQAASYLHQLFALNLDRLS